MGIIDPGNEIVNETSCQYWENELINSRILLNEIDKAILAISQTNIQSYTLDTGQSRQTVTRQDLSNLIDRRDKLIEIIREIELYLNKGKSGVQQVRPYW